jgi:hypothetical protein
LDNDYHLHHLHNTMHPTFMRAAAAAAKKSEAGVLSKGAKKDPELYVRANWSRFQLVQNTPLSLYKVNC